MESVNFLKGFVASLRLESIEFVNPLREDHQKRFGEVVHKMNVDPFIREVFPRVIFKPSPYTGRYFDFVNGMRGLQRELLLFYTDFAGLHLDFSHSFAERILNSYSNDQKEAFGKLALIYARKN